MTIVSETRNLQELSDSLRIWYDKSSSISERRRALRFLESIDRSHQKSFSTQLKNCGAGAPGYPGFQPGNVCAKGSPTDSAGKYIPGAVGGVVGVDTSKYKKYHADAQWAMKKIHKLEQLFEQGQYSQAVKSFYQKKPDGPFSADVHKAQDNLKKLIAEKTMGLASGAKPSADPGVALEQGWKKVGGQLGSNPGGTYEMGGKKYYVKFPSDPNAAHNEALALKLYELAGAGAVKGHLVEIDGKKGIATEWEESTKANWNDPATKVKAAEDFAVHAWLNNWDAVGHISEMDNIRISKDGNPTLVDAGGSLGYKATGGSKAFGNDAPEWTTLRNPSVNPSTAKVFGDMTPQQLVDSANKLKNISDVDIHELSKKFGPGDAVNISKTLIARRDAILSKAKELEEGIDKEKFIASLAPPPKFAWKDKDAASMKWNLAYEKKYHEIYEAAKSGDPNAVHNIPVPYKAGSVYNKKIHEYKQQVLASMKSGGGKPSQDHVVPKAPTSTPKVDPSKFPAKPDFLSSNKVQVSQNNAKVAEALEHASKGDLVALEGMGLTSSPKLAQWHSELVSALSHQLNPPPKPTTISADYSKLAGGVAHPKSGGLKKIGYWASLGEVSGVPNGIPDGVWKKDKTANDALWAAGEAAYKKSGAATHLKNYTGSSYGPMNEALRSGKASATSTAMKAAKGMMKASIELPVGQMLSRKHHGTWDQWKDVKPGTVLSEKGILSTSVDSGVWSGSVHIHMSIGPGVKGIPAYNFSKNKGEKEVLLPPNQRLMVTRVEKVKPSGEGSIKVYATILPTLDDQCCPP